MSSLLVPSSDSEGSDLSDLEREEDGDDGVNDSYIGDREKDEEDELYGDLYADVSGGAGEHANDDDKLVQSGDNDSILATNRSASSTKHDEENLFLTSSVGGGDAPGTSGTGGSGEDESPMKDEPSDRDGEQASDAAATATETTNATAAVVKIEGPTVCLITNLAFDVTDEMLEDKFSAFGTVVDTMFDEDALSGRALGTAAVEMKSTEEARLARQTLNNRTLGTKQKVTIQVVSREWFVTTIVMPKLRALQQQGNIQPIQQSQQPPQHSQQPLLALHPPARMTQMGPLGGGRFPPPRHQMPVNRGPVFAHTPPNRFGGPLHTQQQQQQQQQQQKQQQQQQQQQQRQHQHHRQHHQNQPPVGRVGPGVGLPPPSALLHQPQQQHHSRLPPSHPAPKPLNPVHHNGSDSKHNKNTSNESGGGGGGGGGDRSDRRRSDSRNKDIGGDGGGDGRSHSDRSRHGRESRGHERESDRDRSVANPDDPHRSSRHPSPRRDQSPRHRGRSHHTRESSRGTSRRSHSPRSSSLDRRREDDERKHTSADSHRTRHDRPIDESPTREEPHNRTETSPSPGVRIRVRDDDDLERPVVTTSRGGSGGRKKKQSSSSANDRHRRRHNHHRHDKSDTSGGGRRGRGSESKRGEKRKGNRYDEDLVRTTSRSSKKRRGNDKKVDPSDISIIIRRGKR